MNINKLVVGMLHEADWMAVAMRPFDPKYAELVAIDSDVQVAIHSLLADDKKSLLARLEKELRESCTELNAARKMQKRGQLSDEAMLEDATTKAAAMVEAYKRVRWSPYSRPTIMEAGVLVAKYAMLDTGIKDFRQLAQLIEASAKDVSVDFTVRAVFAEAVTWLHGYADWIEENGDAHKEMA